MQLEAEFQFPVGEEGGAAVFQHKEEGVVSVNHLDVRLERKNKEVEMLKKELKKLEKLKKARDSSKSSLQYQ